MLPAGMLMGMPLPAGVRLLAATAVARRVGMGDQRGAVGARSNPRGIHCDAMGFLDDARMWRGAIRGRRWTDAAPFQGSRFWVL